MSRPIPTMPDIEVFEVTGNPFYDNVNLSTEHDLEPGWYWWSCQPGCLPNGDPSGPFATEQDAIEDCCDVMVEVAIAREERREQLD